MIYTQHTHTQITKIKFPWPHTYTMNTTIIEQHAPISYELLH